MKGKSMMVGELYSNSTPTAIDTNIAPMSLLKKYVKLNIEE